MLLERGEFTATSTELTAYALAFYALGLVGHSVVEIVTRAFYALHDTRTPVVVTFGSMGLNMLLSLLRCPARLRRPGAANTIATPVEMALLVWLVGRRLGGMEWPHPDDGAALSWRPRDGPALIWLADRWAASHDSARLPGLAAGAASISVRPCCCGCPNSVWCGGSSAAERPHATDSPAQTSTSLSIISISISRLRLSSSPDEPPRPAARPSPCTPIRGVIATGRGTPPLPRRKVGARGQVDAVLRPRCPTPGRACPGHLSGAVAGSMLGDAPRRLRMIARPSSGMARISTAPGWPSASVTAFRQKCMP